jgi:hypothetical protein
VAQIAGNRTRESGWQGKFEFPALFILRELQGALSPIKIVQGKLGYFVYS